MASKKTGDKQAKLGNVTGVSGEVHRAARDHVRG